MITDEQILAAPRYYSELIATQATEIDRLKRGDFTADELQDLCHNKAVEAGFCAFAAGCADYQRQLFGKSERDDIRSHLMTLFEKNAHHRWRVKYGAKVHDVIECLTQKLKDSNA